ncbi:MAG: hypothetical protein F6K30_17900 [Cyanothece sp. SIO2G6]|nr:hypothetical protein [Cyanothece sp. SIO2G6]
MIESVDAIARLIIQKDDEHSENKIQDIGSLRMSARLTQEGDWRLSSETKLYEMRRKLNQMLIATGNKALIKANAIKIIHRMIAEMHIPRQPETAEMEVYHEKVQEYFRYLDILSKDR